MEYSDGCDTLVASTDVRREFGNITDVTLWRWERDGVIPPALRIRGRKFWRRSTLERLKAEASKPGGISA